MYQLQATIPAPMTMLQRECSSLQPNCISRELQLISLHTESYIIPTNSKVALREKDNIEDGIGAPNRDLVIYLFLVWVLIAITLIKGKIQ